MMVVMMDVCCSRDSICNVMVMMIAAGDTEGVVAVVEVLRVDAAMVFVVGGKFGVVL